jgi:hypothetical protein
MWCPCGGQEIQQGRLGKLELRGNRGALDLHCVYLDDQSSLARRHSMDLIRGALTPQSSVLSVLFGDFNFVEHAHDRVCKTNGNPSGSRDKVDAEHFKEKVLQKAGLFELQQGASYL